MNADQAVDNYAVCLRVHSRIYLIDESLTCSGFSLQSRVNSSFTPLTHAHIYNVCVLNSRALCAAERLNLSGL